MMIPSFLRVVGIACKKAACFHPVPPLFLVSVVFITSGAPAEDGRPLRGNDKEASACVIVSVSEQSEEGMREEVVGGQ
jgi:hypothetical protein